jgi:hypothetical protein
MTFSIIGGSNREMKSASCRGVETSNVGDTGSKLEKASLIQKGELVEVVR